MSSPILGSDVLRHRLIEVKRYFPTEKGFEDYQTPSRGTSHHISLTSLVDSENEPKFLSLEINKNYLME